MHERRTITVEEAAHLLGISRALAYQAVHTGDIPSLRIGRRIVIPLDALHRKLAHLDESNVGARITSARDAPEAGDVPLARTLLDDLDVDLGE